MIVWTKHNRQYHIIMYTLSFQTPVCVCVASISFLTKQFNLNVVHFDSLYKRPIRFILTSIFTCTLTPFYSRAHKAYNMCWSPVHKLFALLFRFVRLEFFSSWFFCHHARCRTNSTNWYSNYIKWCALHVKRHPNHNERILITTTYHTVTFNLNIYHEFTAHVSYVTDDNVLIPQFPMKNGTLCIRNVCIVSELLPFHCYYGNAMHFNRCFCPNHSQ